MFNGKLKAVTFSFDDGVTQDKRLVELLNKYNLKCTFNLNSGKFGETGELEKNGNVAGHNKILAEEVKALYEGHEVAVHTVNHLRMPELSEKEIIDEVEIDKQNLEKLVGYKIKGMAYPFGSMEYLNKVAPVLIEKTSMKYARATVPCRSFDIQEDLLRFKPTVHITEWEKLYEIADEFINLQADKPQIFYIWGHSYEFDWDNSWDKLEEFFKYISGKIDIFYGTNEQVLLG